MNTIPELQEYIRKMRLLLAEPRMAGYQSNLEAGIADAKQRIANLTRAEITNALADLDENGLRMLCNVCDFFVTQKDLFYLRYPQMRDERFMDKAKQLQGAMWSLLGKVNVDNSNQQTP